MSTRYCCALKIEFGPKHLLSIRFHVHVRSMPLRREDYFQ